MGGIALQPQQKIKVENKMEPRRGEEGALPHKVAGPTLMLLLRQHNQKCMNMMYLIYFWFESLAQQSLAQQSIVDQSSPAESSPFCVATCLSGTASVGSTSPQIPISYRVLKLLRVAPSAVGQSITKSSKFFPVYC